MKLNRILAMLPILLFPAFLFSQTQTLRGNVLDKQAETPLIGATVQVLNVEPAIGATTDRPERTRDRWQGGAVIFENGRIFCLDGRGSDRC